MEIFFKLLPEFNYSKYIYDPNVINLGLAHGIPSILKFCIQSYKKGICKKDRFKGLLFSSPFFIPNSVFYRYFY